MTSAPQTATHVGVIGLGKMGQPMARHLQKTAERVLVYDVAPEPMVTMQSNGCTPVDQPVDMLEHCQLILVIVSFDHQVMDICDGETGLFAEAKKPVTVAICSTIEPETMTRLAEIAPAHVSLLDAPLCRGEQAADSGDLLALVGGDQTVIASVEPHLRTFCSDVDRVGDLGAGQVAKALNNFILWSCISVNHEAFKLGKQYGLDQETLRQSLLKSSGENWAMKTWNRKRTMPWAEKDMMIILNMADQHDLPLTMAGFIKEHIKSVKDEWGLYDRSKKN